MKLKIGELLARPAGSLLPVAYEKEYSFTDTSFFTLEGPVKVDCLLVKEDDSVLVALQHLETTVGIECETCLEHYTTDVSLQKPVERTFFLSLPEEYAKEELNDVFLVDVHHHTIDLTDMLYQEIVLSIPMKRACSEQCKGLCTRCGANRNKNACSCPPEEDTIQHTPLAGLKDLFPTTPKAKTTKKK